MFTDSWIYRGFMRFDLWTKQHGGQGIDWRKMHGFEFGHLRGDYLGLNIVLRSFVMQRWISIKDHTTLCLHAEFVATHAKPPLLLISRWNKEHDVDFWQPPDISRSHLYRGTIPWTPTTAIYREFAVSPFHYQLMPIEAITQICYMVVALIGQIVPVMYW